MASLTFSVDPRSYLKIILPWITYNDGYTSVVEGLFRSPSLKTSLAYQPVGQAQYAKVSMCSVCVCSVCVHVCSVCACVFVVCVVCAHACVCVWCVCMRACVCSVCVCGI